MGNQCLFLLPQFWWQLFGDPLVLKVLCMATCLCWVLGAVGTDTRLLRCSGSFGLEGTVAAPFGLEGTVSDCAGVYLLGVEGTVTGSASCGGSFGADGTVADSSVRGSESCDG